MTTVAPTREQEAEQRAREFVTFCDGLEEGGLVDYARRGRFVAAELLDALRSLDAERRARVAIQEARDRLLAQRFPGACA